MLRRIVKEAPHMMVNALKQWSMKSMRTSMKKSSKNLRLPILRMMRPKTSTSRMISDQPKICSRSAWLRKDQLKTMKRSQSWLASTTGKVAVVTTCRANKLVLLISNRKAG